MLKSLPIVTADGLLRASGIAGEKNDCVVRAYALLCQVPYKTAHGLFAANGRKRGHGVHTFQWWDSRQFGTNNFTWLPNARVTSDFRHHTVYTFMRANASGRFMLLVERHAIPVINGTLPVKTDDLYLNILVLDVYQLKNT